VPALQLWGFEHTAIAIGCTAAFLIAIEKAIGAPGQRSRPFLVLASLSGLLMGWLNPWQALIALVVVAALFVLRPPRRRFLALAVPVAATVAPLIYSQILAHTDASWRAFSHAATATGTAPWWALVASLGPLIALAAVGIRRPASEREWVLLLWPLGNAVVYFVVPDFPPHALAGVTVPLAVLAVRGFGRLRAALRAPAAVAVAGGLLALAAGTVPATINHVQSAADNLTPSFAGVFAQQQLRLTAAEARAMSYLSRAPASGGVLAPAILSLSVPAFTGRQVFVGHFQWEPAGRAALVQAFFDPHATSGAIRRAILRSSHARFVISDCAALAGLTAQLSPLAAPVWHSGCVWIYRVRTSAA
jgi:hypothetical protein